MKVCKICQHDTSTITDTKTEKLYHKCQRCQYIYLDNKFYIDEHREKKHYDKHHNNFESLGYVQMFDDLIDDFVEPHAESIDKALDFGCGEGEVLPILLERRDIECDRYDLFYFPEKVYKDKEYCLITSTEVFEHLSEPLDIMKELLLHVKKNGFLLLMSAFHPNDDEEFFRWWYIRDITHIGFFNIKTFEYLADMLNLRIVKHNGKNTVLFQKL